MHVDCTNSEKSLDISCTLLSCMPQNPHYQQKILSCINSICILFNLFLLGGKGLTKKISEVSDAVSKAKFLQGFISKLNLKLPVIVSPSFSGTFSIPYIFGVGKASSCNERVRGFVSVAPGSTGTVKKEEYQACKVSK